MIVSLMGDGADCAETSGSLDEIDKMVEEFGLSVVTTVQKIEDKSIGF